MKNSTDDIFLLIKSLTKSEKQYFLSCFEGSSRKKDASFIQLFNFIERLETYDEQTIKSHFSTTGIANNFPQAKRFLYKKLLTALDWFHSDYSIEEQVKSLLHQSKILIQKKLENQALQVLKSALKKINKYELTHLLPAFYESYRTLPNALRQVNSINEITNEYDVYKTCLSNLKERNNAWFLNSKVRFLHQQKITLQDKNVQKELSNLMEKNILSEPNIPQTFLAKLDFLQAHATYAFMQGDIDKAYHLNENILQNFEKEPAFIRIYPFKYIATLNNFLIDNVILEKYDVVEIQLQKMMKLETDSTFSKKLNIPVKIFELSSTIKANLFLSKNQFIEANIYIDSILPYLKKYQNSLKQSYLINIFYIIAYIKFANGQFENSLTYQNKLRNEYINFVPTEMRQYLNILFLITHFELNHHNILESLILSTKRYNTINRPLLASEKIVFKLVIEIHNTLLKSDKIARFKNFKTQLAKHKTTDSRIYNYFDLDLWLRSKIENQTMATIQ